MSTFDQLYQNCRLCPHRCGINRLSGERGICRAPATPKIAKTMLHQWEEPCLSGTRGSGAVFFTHCNLKCVYCQNYRISQEDQGREISVEALAEEFIKLQGQGAHNINLVSPTPYLPSLIDSLILAKQRGLAIPVIYNTNGYELPEVIGRLNGLVDIFLPDLKYYSNPVAERLSAAPAYFQTATAAILTMFEQVGPPQFTADNLMTRGLLIRHLVLPNHLEESRAVLKWIRRSLPQSVYISLMAQYFPTYQAKHFTELNRCLTPQEYETMVDYCLELGLENGFTQEVAAADESYVPDF